MVERLMEAADGSSAQGGLITVDPDRATLKVRERGGVFFLAGELDVHSSAAFRRTVADNLEGHRAIVLDVAELNFIDSMGVRTIALLANRLDGCDLIIRYPQDAVLRVFELLEVEEMPGVRIED